jgi:hypothetical protein
MKKTYCVPAALSNDAFFQGQLDKFWPFIENHYEEEWRVQANGDLILTVDDAMLERVLQDNYAEAWAKFGTYGGGMKPGPKFERFMLHRPEHLQGDYIIRGIYNLSQRLVNGPREYFFIQGA